MAGALWLCIGVYLASGLMHVLTGQGARRPRASQAMGALCFCLAAAAYLSLRRYTAPSLDELVGWTKATHVSYYLALPTMAWFFSTYAGRPAKRLVGGVALACALLVALELALPQGAQFGAPVSRREVISPWGDRLSILDGSVTAGEYILLGVAVVVVAFGIACGVAQRRRGETGEGSALLVAVALMGIGCIWDEVVYLAGMRSVYVAAQFGPLGLVLVMSLRLARDAQRERAELQQANARLEEEIGARQRADAELTRSRELSTRLFRQMPDACAVTRQLSGEIVDVNEAFERIFGYRREEIVGRTTTEFGLWVTTADRERALEALLAEQGRIRGYEATLRTREGVLRTCLLSAEQLQVGGDRLLVVAARDVTEMKQAAESLRLTQFAMDHASEGVYWIGANAEFIYVNDEACRSLGYSREELLGMTVHDIAPRRPPASWGELWNTLRERGTLTYETVHRARDGRVFPVELALNYQLFEGRELVCGLARDISERKLAERAAHESAERLRALIEVVSDVVIVIDALGVIQYSSPSVRQVLGYAVEEVVGRSALEFLHPDDRGPAERALVALTAEGPDPGVQQFRARHKDGSWRHVEAVGAVPPPGSPLEGVVVAYRDMTARRELEEHLRETSKLESLGTLAGGVAHDFNNLLTGIIGYVDFVATESTLSPEGQHDVAVVRELAVRAGGLTRQLLAFSRRQTLELTNVQLNSTIVELTKMLGRIIGEDIALRLDLDQDLATVRGDVGQIEQIIMNLAVNARDAMPGGGTLAIETRNVVLDREYSRLHPDTEPGPYVMLAVTDTGCGMDAETQARVFEPFFTTKEVGKGTGLGLSVVYGIVKQHSGGIAVDSTKGHGTRFTVYLPAVTAQVEPTISSPTETGSGRGTETVLVVEDEEVLRQLVVKALENGGYTVLSARHAAEAEELFDTHGGPIDLLLTDVVMPGPSGPELAARLQGKRPGLKVLFTSGFTEHPAVAQGALTSGLPFIQKPFAPVDLLQKVREALGT